MAAATRDRVVLHVDLDSFYAQVEQRRLGLPPSVPLGVVQWGMLIALFYALLRLPTSTLTIADAARPFGVKRGMQGAEAVKLCPEFQCVEVEKISVDTFDPSYATEGEPEAIGKSDTESFPDIGARAPPPGEDAPEEKVSLRRYRKASIEVMTVLRRFIAEDRLERGGIDEVFGDVTDDAASLLEKKSLEEIVAELAQVPGHNMEGDVDEIESPALLAGAVICGRIRAAVLAETGFTMSGGVSNNKTVCKIASALNKPNQQTVLQPSEGAALVRSQPVHKVPLLRGKLGRTVRDFVLGQLQQSADDASITMAVVADHLDGPAASAALGADTVGWLRRLCRGEDHSAIVPRMRPKSLLACKSFRQPGVSSISELRRWLLLLGVEVADRIAEDTASFNRRPKNLVLYHSGVKTRGASGKRPSAPSCTRTTRIPPNKKPTGEFLAETALATLLKLENALPCTRVALAASDFTEVVSTRASITQFMTQRTHAPESHTVCQPSSPPDLKTARPTKPSKRPLEAMFAKMEKKRSAVEGESGVPMMDHNAAGASWPCPFCTFLNDATALSCSMCDNLKGAAPQPPE